MSPEGEIQAFIFAAGLGTRLRPITDTMPKALVPIANRPLIEHVIECLQSQGINDFIVNVHHLAEQVEEYLSDRSDFGSLAISDERDLLRETGGAIKHAQPLFNGNPFVVHNVDIISNVDVQNLLALHKPTSLATLLVSDRKTQRYLLFNDDMRLVGWTNIATGEVKSPYSNIDVAKCTKLAFSGIHVIDPRICELMANYPDKFSIIDFYLDNAHEQEIYGVVQDNLRMIDVGKLNSLDDAEALLDELKD
ncbi:MAG: nucleotidyltransferase family protein [Paludibacteraceae bacterium]|jgi:NDP-sugar pyrophosphorylase family protein|nr:nucleotidyltransferase family protein [Paludibacteraceae bacterium]